MRYSGGFLVASFVVLGLASSSLGQPGVQWSPDFEGAKVHARQGGRLVMAYFSAPWCPACIEMERSVFSQPGIASSVHAAFIPVKINHDQTPELVRHYGVRSLPAILVLSPDGAPLDRIEGRVTPQQLGERLNRVVAQNLRPATLPTSPQQAIAHQPPGSRPYPGPHVAGPHVAGPPLAGLASRPPTAGPPASRPPAAGPPAAGPPAVGPPLAGPPPVVQSPPTPPAPASATPPLHATAPVTPGPRYAAEVARTPAVQQNPPLAIEGYCVVSLCDDLLAGQRRWILGNRAHGVIHRDRTYLFVNSDKAARFFQEPDRYAPVLSGDDVVVAVDEGRSAPGLREHGAFFGGRVYLFSSEETVQRFENNPNRYANSVLRLSSRPTPRQ